MYLEDLNDPTDKNISSHKGSTINLYIVAVLTLWKSICRSIKDIHNDDILRICYHPKGGQASSTGMTESDTMHLFWIED